MSAGLRSRHLRSLSSPDAIKTLTSPPPPPKVEVANPLQRPITRYLEATGNTAAIKSVDLVARVQGFLASIDYKDGTFVKEGTTLFTIEPETYKLKLDQAQAAEAGAQATVKQAEADFKRQTDLVAQTGGLAGDARYLDLDARQRAGQSAAGAGQHQDRRDQLRLHQGHRTVRRRRQRASGVGRRTRRRRLAADAAGHHRRARSDLCELQRQRTGRAEGARRGSPPRHERGRPDAASGPGRPADRGRLSASGQSRLRLAHHQRVDRHAGGARRHPQSRPRAAARLSSCASACPSSRSRTPCSSPTRRTAATRAAATCWS